MNDLKITCRNNDLKDRLQKREQYLSLGDGISGVVRFLLSTVLSSPGVISCERVASRVTEKGREVHVSIAMAGDTASPRLNGLDGLWLTWWPGYGPPTLDQAGKEYSSQKTLNSGGGGTLSSLDQN